MMALELYSRVESWAASVAHTFIGMGAITPDDLLQESFLICHEVVLKYNVASETEMVYIVKGAIRNRFITLYRYHSYRARRTDVVDPDTIPGYETAFEVLVASELVAWIRSKLNNHEDAMFDCLLRTPDGVLDEARMTFELKQKVKDHVVMHKNEVVVTDSMIAHYFGVSPATVSRFKVKLTKIVKEMT